MNSRRLSVRHLLHFAAIASLGIPAVAKGAAVQFIHGTFTTTWQNPSGATAANASNSVTVDLSESIGFEPGKPIEIRCMPEPGVQWSGSYQTAINRPVAFTFSGTVEISVGAYSMSYNESWALIESGSVGGRSTTATYGEGVPHSFIVPWGTDLSEVTITLTDATSVGGTSSPRLLTSSMSFAGVLLTTSVPEPSALLMAGVFPALLLVRRRRQAA